MQETHSALLVVIENMRRLVIHYRVLADEHCGEQAVEFVHLARDTERSIAELECHLRRRKAA